MPIHDDCEDFEGECPKCQRFPIRRRGCDSIRCEDGRIDRFEEDPLRFDAEAHYAKCPDCNGHGEHIFCPECGSDWTEHFNKKENLDG